jgi:quinol monooxygenase YgiN
MTQTVELTRFRTAAGRAEELVAARPGMLVSFREDRAGFIRADLVRLGDDEWLDIVVWESPEAFAASRAKGGNTPQIAAFFAPITELVSTEEGTLAT